MFQKCVHRPSPADTGKNEVSLRERERYAADQNWLYAFNFAQRKRDMQPTYLTIAKLAIFV